MRKGRDGGTGKKTEKNGKKKKKEKTDENSGHYVIASSRPPERRPPERRTLLPIFTLPKEKNALLLKFPTLNGLIVDIRYFL